ncbi:MAG: TIGR02281 family clan AA aspartic protease [Pseudomonadota bacterium]
MRNGILFFVYLWAASCGALEIEAKMLAQGSAVLQIDGKQRMLREGMRSPEGVLLVSADNKQAVLEVDGKKQSLGMSRSISTQFKKAEKTEVRIASGIGGHYRIQGLINGAAVYFIVDTGATFVSMGQQEAQRLGIDYRGGTPITMNTANGLAKAYHVTLSSVSVGNIVVNNVEAVVHAGDFALELLLGNSYLSKVDLNIDQGVLVLREK